MKMKASRLIGFVVLAICLAGCGNADFQKTKDGMVYTIFNKGKGEVIKPGTFLKIHYDAVVGDSVLFSTFGKVPVYGKYDTMPQSVYDFIDFLGKMKVGDSATYVRSVDTMAQKGMLQIGGVFKKGGTILGHLRILGTFPSEVAIQEDQAKEVEIEKAKEIAGLEGFLKTNKVANYIKTPEGVFVLIESQGTGPKADTGLNAVVKYTGYLKNGIKFDSNTDTAFGVKEPFEFPVGKQAVIQGWDIGIRLFNQGGKGKIYVPAMLGYGMQGRGEKLPAYSDLIFDIELVQVKQAQSNSALPPVQ